MFGGRYVVDDYALILKALFLLVGVRRRAAEPDTRSKRAATTRASSTCCC